MKEGRPLKYSDPEKLQKDINAYFAKCDARTKTIIGKDGQPFEVAFPIPYTIEGLAVALDVNRQTILNYEKNEQFFGIISRAKERIQANKVEGGLDGSYNPKMATFMLINNYKYSEQQKQDTQEHKVIIEFEGDDNK